MREVTGTDLPLLEAIDQELVPIPPLMHQQSWLTWRKASGKRPGKRKTGERGTGMGREMALWKEAMAKYHGEDWRDKLLNLETPEEEDEREEDSQPEESMLEAFRRPRAEYETVAGFDARRLRAGNVLLGKHPRQL